MDMVPLGPKTTTIPDRGFAAKRRGIELVKALEGWYKTPMVGVMGSGSEEHRDLAEPLGVWLAREGLHLLNGGGGSVMEAVSRAYHRVHWRRGLVVGILPGVFLDGECRPPEGYPNPSVELPIRTHLPLSGRRGT